MELPKQVGYILATNNGRILCKEEGRLFLAAFPLSADTTVPFLLCKYKSGAEEYAREWYEQVFFDIAPAQVKPVKVVVVMREFKKEAKESRNRRCPMARKYTADEMREMAAEAEVIEVADQFCGHDMDTIASMLRQAADLQEREEREKKYQYSIRTPTGWIDDEATQNTLEDIEPFCEDGSTIVRREVGEWEEVPNEQG